MKVVALPSFHRGFAKLSRHVQEKTWYQINVLVEHVGSPVKPKSLRLKKLPGENFEISINMDIRVLFQFQKDALVLVLCGDHEDVHRYLRR